MSKAKDVVLAIGIMASGQEVDDPEFDERAARLASAGAQTILHFMLDRPEAAALLAQRLRAEFDPDERAFMDASQPVAHRFIQALIDQLREPDGVLS